VQLAAQVRKAEQQEKTIQSLIKESKRLKDQMQSATAARQKMQDGLDQQLQVRVCIKGSEGTGKKRRGEVWSGEEDVSVVLRIAVHFALSFCAVPWWLDPGGYLWHMPLGFLLCCAVDTPLLCWLCAALCWQYVAVQLLTDFVMH
jgi:hypothetical protein